MISRKGSTCAKSERRFLRTSSRLSVSQRITVLRDGQRARDGGHRGVAGKDGLHESAENLIVEILVAGPDGRIRYVNDSFRRLVDVRASPEGKQPIEVVPLVEVQHHHAHFASAFADAGLPLLQGECLLHRQGNFYAANWPKGTKLGKDGQVDAFYLPGSTAAAASR